MNDTLPNFFMDWQDHPERLDCECIACRRSWFARQRESFRRDIQEQGVTLRPTEGYPKFEKPAWL